MTPPLLTNQPCSITKPTLLVRLVALSLSCLLGIAAYAEEKPVPIIFDTDITGDVDDVLALAMLHTLADRGKCELLAVTVSKKHPQAAPFVDAVNTFYGRPDIPVGTNPNAPDRDSKYLKLADSFPHDLKDEDAEDAVSLLKKTLTAAEDRSVTIVQVGLATNLADLLKEEGGPALIRQKVKELSVMAGSLETINDNNRYLEANVRNHVQSMQILAAEWPNEIPVVWSGFEIGIAAPYPRASIRNDFNYVEKHPVKEAYLLHSGPEHDRPTWDLTSVLYAVFPQRGYFGFSKTGRVTVEDDGFTRFSPGGKEPAQKRDRFLTMTPGQTARVQEALVHLVAQPPAHIAAAPKLEKPVKLIFDTDMGNDIDDAMALALIHQLERRGAVELLAVTSTKDHEKSAPFIDALNTYYGRPDIPVGAVRNGVTPEPGRYNGLADNYDHDLKSGKDAPDAVALLRKTLAAQPDQSVKIAQVGFFTNLAQLLESEPDEHSDLDGVALAKAKVKELIIMAGAFQTVRFDTRHLEYNVRLDVPSAQSFAKTWPTPIIWSGYEIGIAAAYPWGSIQQDYQYDPKHIIREGYLAYVPTKPHDRPTWDLTAVLHAVYPDRGYFDLSPPGLVTVEDDGATLFRPNRKGKENGKDRYLVFNGTQAERTIEAFVQLVSEPPVETK